VKFANQRILVYRENKQNRETAHPVFFRDGQVTVNCANEANFAETMSVVEAQEPIQVTADSGALWGLDKGVALPGEGPHAGTGRGPSVSSIPN